MNNAQFYDTMLKLFKRRTFAATTPNEPTEQMSPFEIIASSEYTAPLPLNKKLDMPEDFPLELWNALCDIRDKKVAAEADVAACNQAYKQIQSVLQTATDATENINQEMNMNQEVLNDWEEFKFQAHYNVECIFELKQGQVEVQQAPFVTDYSEALLIDRTEVESLNGQVRVIGNSKVDALKEIKDYRKGIHQLEWEMKMLDMEAEGLVIKIRDIQLLRVTKQMQEYLRSGDEHKQSQEIASLEKNAEHSEKAHSHKLDEQNRSIAKLKKLIKHKSDENAALDAQLNALNSSINGKHTLWEMAAVSHKPKGDGMKDIFRRRRLAELARSQDSDILILEEELQRLRLRTYPAFPASG